MKIDVAICVLILLLTLCPPLFSFWAFENPMSDQPKTLISDAKMREELALKLDAGELECRPAEFASALRLGAASDRATADMLNAYSGGVFVVNRSLIFNSICQALLLWFLISRRNRRKKLSSPSFANNNENAKSDL